MPPTSISIPQADGHARYAFAHVDICDEAALRSLFDRYAPQAVMNLAAESHVDRSIDGPADFIRTNIGGTFTLLQEALRFWRGQTPASRSSFRFLHVSTDEVYGSLGADGLFTETTAYRPSSPYSASKASSDHLVRAWRETYELPTLVTNCSNNYGPYQFPEKLIPHMIIRGLRGEELPVYGDGQNIRDWLYVEDHASALISVLSMVETPTLLCGLWRRQAGGGFAGLVLGRQEGYWRPRANPCAYGEVERRGAGGAVPKYRGGPRAPMPRLE